MKKIILLMLIAFSVNAIAQLPSVRFKDGLKIYLNDDSTRYVEPGLLSLYLNHICAKPVALT